MSKSPKSRGSTRRDDAGQKTATAGGGFLLFRDLPADEATAWLETPDEDATQDRVRQFLRFERADRDLKEASLLDFYTSVALWCRDHDATESELSIIFSVCRLLMEKIEGGATQAEATLEIQKLLAAQQDGSHSGLESMEPQRLSDLLRMLAGTLLQHHSLFSFLLRQQPSQLIITRQLTAEALPSASLPFPPPLTEGLPEDLYRRAVLRTGTSKARTVVEEDVEAAKDEDEEAAEQESQQELQQQTEQQQQLDLEAAMVNLSADDVQEAVDSVCRAMLPGLEAELAAKIKEREIAWINKINKVHNQA